ELYDIEADPHETHNLADSPEHRPILERFRNAQRQWGERTLDLGFMPEYEMHVRVPGAAPHEMARRGGQVFSHKRIRETLELSRLGPKALPTLRERLADPDCAIRYWAILALNQLGADARPAADALKEALADPSADVRLAAAGALCRLDRAGEALQPLIALLRHKDPWVRTRAAGALCEIGEQARPVADDMKPALKDKSYYVRGIVQYALNRMKQRGGNRKPR
ncbi:HEAT repeat domain-containing protein, partial [Planctomycetota bacterium]